MVYRRKEVLQPPAPRRMNAQKVARAGKYYRFVHHHPMLHPVAKTPGTKSRIVRKPVDHPAVGPATPRLQCLRKIPVIKRNPGLYSLLQTIINNPVIKIDTGWVHRQYPIGHKPRPGNGETEIGDVQCLHQVDIALIIAIKITGLPRMISVANFSFFCGERVPDGWTFPLGLTSSLNLKGRCRNTPLEVVAKLFTRTL